MLKKSQKKILEDNVAKPKFSLSDIMRIQIDFMPPINHFFSLTKEQISSNELFKTMNNNLYSISMEIPKLLRPGYMVDKVEKCEDQLEEVEMVSDLKITQEDFAKELTKNNFQLSTKISPIIDPIIRNEQAKIYEFKLEEKPKQLGLLEIKNIEFGNSDFNGKVMDMMIYDKYATTEILRFYFDEKTISNSRKLENVHFPFIKDPQSKVLCILYDKTNDGFVPYAIGYEYAISAEIDNTINLNWFKYDPSSSFMDVFNLPKNDKLDMSMKINVNIFQDIQSDKNVMKVTPFSSMFPSPILSISNVCFTFEKAKKSNTYFLKIKLLNKIDQKKEKLKMGIDLDSSDLKDSIISSVVTIKSQKLIFPDTFQFLLDSKISNPDNLFLSYKLYKINGKKKKKTNIKGSIQVSKIQQDYSNKIKKGTLTLTLLFPFMIFPKSKSNNGIFNNYFFEQIINSQSSCLQKLANLFKEDDMLKYIENVFCPPNKFTEKFILELINSINTIETNPKSFLILLFKSMCCENFFKIDLLQQLFIELAKSKSVNVRIATSFFIIILRMFFSAINVHKLTFLYLSNLTIEDRLFVFQYLFYDIGFIQSLLLYNINPNPNESVYIPILSLFFKSINEAFLKNDEKTVNFANNSIFILTTTLELFSDIYNARICSKKLFPVLPIIFTFFDSIKDSNKLKSFVLFTLKNCEPALFKFYYDLLSEGNQLRFLEFLILQTDIDSISTPEIARRMIHFLQFFFTKNKISEQELKLIIMIFIKMLESKKQDQSSYPLIYQALSLFIQKFDFMIFKSNDIMFTIYNHIFPLSQRKLEITRTTTLGFIQFFLQREKSVSRNNNRSEICLQIAICDIYSQNMIPNFLKISKFPKQAINIYNQLKSETIQEIILSNKYNSFPAIKGLLYYKLSQLYESKSDYYSAFITKWKLCSLISNHKFPYIELEKFNSLKLKECESLVSVSQVFDNKFFCKCLYQSIDLCKNSGFYWCIHKCCRFILELLENQKDYELLQSLCIKTSEFYNQCNNVPNINFCFKLIKKGRDEFIKIISNDKIKEDSIIVKYDINELFMMQAKNFHLDSLIETDSWDDTYIERIVYTTIDPLPSMYKNAKVSKKKVIKITKKDFYLQKYQKFADRLNKEMINIQGLIPSDKMKNLYLGSGIYLSSEPLLKLINKMVTQKKSYYKLFGTIGKNEESTETNIPDEIIQKIYLLWDEIIKALKVIEEIECLNKSREEEAQFNQMKTFFGIVQNTNLQNLSEY